MKKKGERNPLNPKTKKSFGAVTSKLDTGIKNKGAQASGARVSDGVTAKRKDELYGRLEPNLLAKFLSGKFNQNTFVTKLKVLN